MEEFLFFIFLDFCVLNKMLVFGMSLSCVFVYVIDE